MFHFCLDSSLCPSIYGHEVCDGTSLEAVGFCFGLDENIVMHTGVSVALCSVHVQNY